MIIKNKRTGIEYELSKELYDKLVQQRIHRRYTIIDATDIPKQKVQVPKLIEEYQKDPQRLKLTKKEEVKPNTDMK